METPPPPPPPAAAFTRRVPPPCWTRDETLALIQAYRDKWFALGRGHLRAADWDAVADAVSSSAESGTPKTAVQCRHKIEKMRKRFRSEKQRGLKRPGKFYSSWDLFPLLDSMNFASVGSGDHHDQGDGDDVKVTAVDGLRLKLTNNGKIDRDSESNQDDFRAGYGSKYGFVDGDFDFNGKLGDGFDVKLLGNRNFVAQLVNYGSNGKIANSYTRAVDFDHGDDPGVSSVGGFPLKSLGDRSLVPSGLKPKNSSSRGNEKFKANYDFTSSVLPGVEAKDYNKLNEDFRTEVDLDFHEEVDRVNAGCGAFRWENRPGVDEGFVGNGYASSSRFDLPKRRGVKRGLDAVEEMVLSINFLSEVFVRVEKTKMEMLREIEKTRMEMEMKHNQMILDSQQQIVDAFAKALLETKKSKKKMKQLSRKANGNGDE